MISPIVSNGSKPHNVFANTDKVLRPDTGDRDRWEADRNEVFKGLLVGLIEARLRQSDRVPEHPRLPDCDRLLASQAWQAKQLLTELEVI